MLRNPAALTSGVKTPEVQRLFGTAEAVPSQEPFMRWRLARFAGGGIGNSGGYADGHAVWRGPYGRAVLDLDLVHGDFRSGVIDLDEEIVVVNAHVFVEVIVRAGDEIGMRAATARDEISDATVLVALVVVNMAVEDDEARACALLVVFQHFSECLLGWPRGMATAKDFQVGGTGVRRMVENEEHKIHVGGKMIELGREPRTLRAGEFVEIAIENEHERIGDPRGIEAIFLEFREALEIIGEGGIQIAVQIVIANRGINRNFAFPPKRGFGVPHLPVLGVVTIQNDVSTDGDKDGIFLGNRGNQRMADFGIGGIGVRGIVEARVAEGDEAEWDGSLKLEGDGLRLR